MLPPTSISDEMVRTKHLLFWQKGIDRARRASTLSIRSPGALPMSYAAIKLIRAYLSHPSSLSYNQFCKLTEIETRCDQYLKFIAQRILKFYNRGIIILKSPCTYPENIKGNIDTLYFVETFFELGIGAPI